MELSVSGFKSIAQVDKFNLAPLTMLAGINSSGKTSLLQAILLLKQTIESESKQVLQYNGPYLSSDSLTDILFKKSNKREMSVEMVLGRDEISNINDFIKYAEVGGTDLSSITLSLSITVESGECYVQMADSKIHFSDNSVQDINIFRLKRKKLYNVSYSSPLMVGSNVQNRSDKRMIRYATLEFTNFLPFFAEETVGEEKRIYSLSIMKELMLTLQSFFSKVCYVGPSRIEPVLSKSYSSNIFENVGADGANTRFILNEKKNTQLEGYDETLTQAVSRWACRTMGLAKSIDVTKDVNRLYRTVITNAADLKVDLCQMGFGLSQILPIIVQGLLTPKGGLFIAVDPDVHIHPKVQGLLVDFFIELKEHGRIVVVETHSDHLITRLRRRVAEKKVNNNDVNLCFVSNVNGASNYVSYALDSTGAFTTKLPVDFMDALDDDYRAIIEAKFNKNK